MCTPRPRFTSSVLLLDLCCNCTLVKATVHNFFFLKTAICITFLNVTRCCQRLLWHSLNNTGSITEIFLSKGFWTRRSLVMSQWRSNPVTHWWKRVISTFLWDAIGFHHDGMVLAFFDSVSDSLVGLILSLTQQLAWFQKLHIEAFLKW